VRKAVVAIVGRPNVGKSTLFNRLTGRRLAIVESIPGVTRDRLYAEGEWEGRRFFLVDTGGIAPAQPDDPIQQQVYEQAVLAVDEADLILFVVDGPAGLQTLDREVAEILRRAAKPVVLVVNKADSYQPELAADFYALGFGDPVLVSAEHALNLDGLLDAVVAHLPPATTEEESDAVKVAIIGRPNVGKSSLVNALLGEERVIVSPVPGTTRDAVDTPLRFQDQDFLLIDTAGIRRARGRASSRDAVEYYSVLRAIQAVERADVTLVLLDAGEFLLEQDKKVAAIPHETGRATILVVNKWDVVEKTSRTVQEYEKRLRAEMPFLRYAPALFISARTGLRVGRVLPEVIRVAAEYSRRVSTGRLNQAVRDAVDRRHPPSRKGKALKIYYATQVQVKPPTINFWVNDPELVHFSYKRFLENRLREEFGFTGTPLRLLFKKRGKKAEDY
jgi:GTP-binding protein